MATRSTPTRFLGREGGGGAATRRVPPCRNRAHQVPLDALYPRDPAHPAHPAQTSWEWVAGVPTTNTLGSHPTPEDLADRVRHLVLTFLARGGHESTDIDRGLSEGEDLTFLLEFAARTGPRAKPCREA